MIVYCPFHATDIHIITPYFRTPSTDSRRVLLSMLYRWERICDAAAAAAANATYTRYAPRLWTYSSNPIYRQFMKRP